MKHRSRGLLIATAAFILAGSASALAEKQYDPGATDTTIKLGNTMAYSGPASAFGVIGKAMTAYWTMINDNGGINGRKIIFLSYDDAYSPPKTVEQVRKLVEGDEVLAMVTPLGTAPNAAIGKYLNDKKVPHLFLASGAARWNNPTTTPWSMGFTPDYQTEGRAYAKYLLKEKPLSKLAVMYQNDDFGKDVLKGLKDGLGDKAASMIVKEESYEVTVPTVDSVVVSLKASGADVFMNLSTPKFAAQAIRKVNELGWKPIHILAYAASSIGATLKPVGFDVSQGIISANFVKDLSDPRWKDDKGVKAATAFLDKYMSDANRADAGLVVAYNHAQITAYVLRQCGDDLTRANIMKQAASLQNVELDLLLPGITVNTSPTDFAPIEQWQLMRFQGETWEYFGDVISAR